MMTECEATRLLCDPHLPWQGASAYVRVNERLAQTGHPKLGPSSTTSELQDALYVLRNRQDREALDEIRYIARRLAVDFVMYHIAEKEAGRLDALCKLPLPMEPLKLRLLSDIGVDFAGAVDLSEPPEPGQAPSPVTVEFNAHAPIDIGPIALDEATILGDGHGEG